MNSFKQAILAYAKSCSYVVFCQGRRAQIIDREFDRIVERPVVCKLLLSNHVGDICDTLPARHRSDWMGDIRAVLSASRNAASFSSKGNNW